MWLTLAVFFSCVTADESNDGYHVVLKWPEYEYWSIAGAFSLFSQYWTVSYHIVECEINKYGW